MALTWQNVAAPDFSGAIASQKVAGDALSNGFSAIQTALLNYQANNLAADKQAEDVRMGQAKYADDHRRALLVDQTVNLQNAGLTETNNQTALDNDKKQEYEAARPAAVKLINEIQSLNASGNPADKAKALELQRANPKIMSDYGWTPENINTQHTSNLEMANAGLKSNKAFQEWGDSQVGRDKRLAGEKLFTDLIPKAADANDAARLLREANVDPDVAMVAMEKLKIAGPALFEEAVDPAQVIMNQRLAEQKQVTPADAMKRIQYHNQNSIRNDPLSDKLSAAIAPVLDRYNVTMKVFSGGQETAEDAAAGKGNHTGGVRHNHGGAGDVEFYAEDGHKLDPGNPSDERILTSIVHAGMDNGIKGWGEGDDYMGRGRLHLGFGNPGVWGKNGKGENAAPWLRRTWESYVPGNPNTSLTGTPEQNSDPVTSALNEANKATDASAAANNQGQLLLRNAADANQARLDRSLESQGQAQTLIDTMTASSPFMQDSNLVDTITNRPDKNLSDEEVAEKLFKSIGDDSALTLPQVTDELRMVMGKYGLAPDLAGAFLKNSVDQSNWGTRFFEGERRVYDSALDAQYKRLYGDNVDGKPDLQKAVARIQQERGKEFTTKKVSTLMADVEKAKNKYFTALNRKNSGRSDVDAEGPLKKYEMMQEVLDRELKKIADDERTAINANSKTGL